MDGGRGSEKEHTQAVLLCLPTDSLPSKASLAMYHVNCRKESGVAH